MPRFPYKKKLIYPLNQNVWGGRRGHDRMVVGFTTTYAINPYHQKCCEFESHSDETTLCDKVCQWRWTGRWFSPGPPVSSSNKNDRHDITEILLKVALNTINHQPPQNVWLLSLMFFLSRYNACVSDNFDVKYNVRFKLTSQQLVVCKNYEISQDWQWWRGGGVDRNSWTANINYIPMTLHSTCSMQRQFIDIHFLCIHT